MASPPKGNVKNKWRYHIKNSIYKTSDKPLDINCGCKICNNYTQGYIRHLFASKEQLASRLITYHNVFFYISLMGQIRESIKDKTFNQLKHKWFS